MSSWLPTFKKDNSPGLFEMTTVIPARFKCPRCKECGQFRSFAKVHECPVTGLPQITAGTFSMAIDTLRARVRIRLDEEVSRQMFEMREIHKDRPCGISPAKQMLRSASIQDSLEGSTRTTEYLKSLSMGLPNTDDTGE